MWNYYRPVGELCSAIRYLHISRNTPCLPPHPPPPKKALSSISYGTTVIPRRNWAAIPLYLDELIESVQRKALKIIFGRVDYAEALVLAGLESLSDRRVGACKRFMATACQMSPFKNVIPSPAAFESHYSMRVQLPRRQHGHTRRINDFVTYKFQWMYVND